MGQKPQKDWSPHLRNLSGFLRHQNLQKPVCFADVTLFIYFLFILL